MRKVAATILAFFYLFTASGVNIHFHYCMGELADWGLGYNKSKTCGSCGMEKSDEKDNGCCKDEHKFVKTTTDQKVVESSFQFSGFIATAILPDYTDLPSIEFTSFTEESSLSNSPPRSSCIAFYILNRTFLI